MIVRRHQPALLGGLFIGALTSLPVVNLANLCCCLWVVAGGVLTAYLQQQRRPDPVDAGEAALGGLLAGLVGALIAIPISVALAMSGDVQEQFRGFIDEAQMPPELRDRLTGMFEGPRFVLLNAAITLPVNAVFGMLGGLLGSAIFRRKTPPASAVAPAAPDQPPPAL